MVYEHGLRRVRHTHLLTAAELAELPGFGLTAHLAQQWVDKAFDVRLVAVGRTLFATAIHAHSDAGRLDWRTDYGALTYCRSSCRRRCPPGCTSSWPRPGCCSAHWTS